MGCRYLAPLLLATLFGCAETSTTRLASNVIRIDATTAPTCKTTGAMEVLERTAAIETIRLGYDRYVIGASGARDTTRVVGATYYPGGYGGYGYAAPIYGGSMEAAVVVTMFKTGDPAGRSAIDARSALGQDWQEIVSEGPPTKCM